jgi:hypothetical protein
VWNSCVCAQSALLSGLEQQARGGGRDVRALERVGGDVRVAAQVSDPARANQPRERNLVDALARVVEVPRGVDVRA